MACARLLLQPTRVVSHGKSLPYSNSLSLSRSLTVSFITGHTATAWRFFTPSESLGNRILMSPAKASPENDGIVSAGEDGVSLGTLKLPLNTDLQRFESLLFQWGNSLCQGANLPLPVPLKVDKIPGGARLGFITIGEGKTEVLVYIDCLVSPAADGSPPIFRAIRNGPLREVSPPGEPRIMRSLLLALQKSVEIATI